MEDEADPDAEEAAHEDPDGLGRGFGRTVGQNRVLLRRLIIPFPQSEGVMSGASKRVRKTKRESSAEPANERAARANQRTDERVGQYLRLDS